MPTYPRSYLSTGPLAGAVPGTVLVPIKDQPVAVEIGIPKIGPTPLYSLALGPKELETKSVELVVSHYSMGKVHFKNMPFDLTLQPNTRRKISIRRGKSDEYKVIFPATPYNMITSFLSSVGTTNTKSGMVPIATNKSNALGINHLSYSKDEKQIVPMVAHNMSWSGSLASWGRP